MYMVMFVLDDPDRLDEVLEAWEAVGIRGATLIESTGVNRRRIARQVGTSYMAGINRLIGHEEEGHFTLLTIVPNEAVVHACLEAAERIVGDLDQPNTGILVAWPLAVVKGVPGRAQEGE